MAGFDKDAYAAEVRARFDELTAKKEAIHAVAEPLRAARDQFVSEASATEAEMNAKIREAEAGLFELDQERAMLARQLAPAR